MAKDVTIFLDRDRTFIGNTGYVNQSPEVSHHPISFEAQPLLQKHFTFLINANQSGINEEIATENNLSEVNKYTKIAFHKKAIAVYDISGCTYKNEENSGYKKPTSLYNEKASQLYNPHIQSLITITYE